MRCAAAPGAIATPPDMRPPDDPIYLDYPATTPVDPRVTAAMAPWWTDGAANPHAADHARGVAAAQAVTRARADVAGAIGARAADIVFTSGATESANLAVKGAALAARPRGRDHVVTVATDHVCVLESARWLEGRGFAVTIQPVDGHGRLDLDRLDAALSDRTALVSAMAVNNETGVRHPLAEIGALCRRHGALFHTDAAQAFGRIDLDVAADAIDLLSLSGHKIYGPPGIGALYVRATPPVPLEPLIHGGGQERGLRAGTVPVALAVGLGRASVLAQAERAEEQVRIAGLEARLLDRLDRLLGPLVLAGAGASRIPGILTLTFAGASAEDVMAACPDLALSSGAACTAATGVPSPVLTAMGYDAVAADASLRLGLGRFTTAAEVDRAADRLAAGVQAVRAGAPEWPIRPALASTPGFR